MEKISVQMHCVEAYILLMGYRILHKTGTRLQMEKLGFLEHYIQSLYKYQWQIA